MHKLIISILLLCFSYSQQLYKQFPPHQFKTNKQVNNSVTLWDNNVRYFGGAILSTQLNGLPVNQRSIEVVDDFYIPPGFSWSIDSIFAIGTPNTNPNKFRLIILNDIDGNVGTVIYGEEFVPPNSVAIRHKLNNPLLLNAGSYWFSVIAVYEDSTNFFNAGWFWDASPDEQRFEARIRDFTAESQVTTWTPFSAAGIPHKSIVFSLYGTDLTAPAFKDSVALVELYNQSNGAAWSTSTNWLSQNQLNTWHGMSQLKMDD